MGISNWLAAVKDLNLKEKYFTGSKGPQRNAVLEKKEKKGKRRKKGGAERGEGRREA
jgi:hypothetical protein